jgi:hypothetical protein
MKYGAFPSAVLICLIMVVMTATTASDAQESIERILMEADKWIISDTTRIFQFIEKCNDETLDKLHKSTHWQSTLDDLSFLLSIDYIGDPQMDNMGRMYYIMRITGQTGALFYADELMGFPHQLTPNNPA